MLTSFGRGWKWASYLVIRRELDDPLSTSTTGWVATPGAPDRPLVQGDADDGIATRDNHYLNLPQILGLGGRGIARMSQYEGRSGHPRPSIHGSAGSRLLAGSGGRLTAKNVGTLQGDTQDGLTLGDTFEAALLDVQTVLGIGRSGLSAGTLRRLGFGTVSTARRNSPPSAR
jgi:hypothetical protein